MKRQSSSIGHIDGIALVGFRLNPDSQSPDVFTLVTYGDCDSPVQEDGEILFFTEPALALKAYERYAEDIRAVLPPPTKVDLVCDIPAALWIVESQDRDESATVLNCLNTIFDLVRATGFDWPADYKRVLFSLADYLTFHRDLTPFLDEQGNRTQVINALLWCIGGVMVRAKLIG
jgi:hypothetical protein